MAQLIEMQTFLPYASFRDSAKVLDTKRLGKQRLEALTIHATLIGKRPASSVGWKNHPAVKMWQGYEQALLIYGMRMCDEWRDNRGYQDTIGTFLTAYHLEHYGSVEEAEYELPPWLGVMELHWSHRSNLIRKKPEYYQQFWPELSSNLPYWWPSHHPELFTCTGES